MIKKIYFAARYFMLKPTKMSRQQLRAQRLMLDDKVVSAATWIDKMAERLPLFTDGTSQHDNMWHWYSLFGLKGLNYYLDYSRYKVNKQQRDRRREKGHGIINPANIINQLKI